MTATIIYAGLGGKGNINSVWVIDGDEQIVIEPVTVDRINKIKERYTSKKKKNVNKAD